MPANRFSDQEQALIDDRDKRVSEFEQAFRSSLDKATKVRLKAQDLLVVYQRRGLGESLFDLELLKRFSEFPIRQDGHSKNEV